LTRQEATLCVNVSAGADDLRRPFNCDIVKQMVHFNITPLNFSFWFALSSTWCESFHTVRGAAEQVQAR